MPFVEAVRLAFQMIWAQKMKSVFALIGVFIGVTFLIAVVSVVEGMNRYMTDRFAGTLLGINTFRLRRFPNFELGNVTAETWRSWVRRPPVTYQDAEAVAAGITVPVVTAWESEGIADVEHRGRRITGVRVIGATERYFDIKTYSIERGRAFSAQEVRSGQPVAVLGRELADSLFPGLDPIGREIRVRNFPYRVIGVVERQGNLFGFSLDKFLVAPALSPVKRVVAPPGVIDALIIKASSQEEMRQAMVQAEAIMRIRRGLRPTEENNFTLEGAEAVLEFWERINRILLAALPGLVSISLVVGGIVIMNIMLMSVAERTREIGIRKSLGARRRDIMRQFLVESSTLATIGAALGVAAGLVGAAAVAAATPLPASVAPWSIAVGVLLGAGVGVAAGVYPATRAAKLDPVEAIRHET
jgi:putative ABC transport system permease protein